MFPQYGELRPTSGWDRFGSLGHPCKFQRVSRLGSVTARHSSSGRQPNFAALNRGHHLYSAGRPSRSGFGPHSSWFSCTDASCFSCRTPNAIAIYTLASLDNVIDRAVFRIFGCSMTADIKYIRDMFGLLPVSEITACTLCSKKTGPPNSWR